MTTNLTLRVAALALLAGTACGGGSAFRLTSDDNNPARLAAALQQRQLGGGLGTIAADNHARVVAVVAGAKRKLVAYDLQTGTQSWIVDADVQSRVVMGADFVACMEGADLVVRTQLTGDVRWKAPQPEGFVGLSADEDRVFIVTKESTGKRATFWLTAFAAGTGETIWRADAPGQLGAPAAQGGLVFSPFVKQWLAVLDARTGEQLTRIRGIDEEISFVRSTSDATWFGSTDGAFRLDERAASGRRADATYGKLALPPQLAKATFAPDAYDPVQAGYSAADRTRILWRGDSQADGPLKFTGGVAVHYFRFILGYDTAGALTWAYSHPRVELVASEHVGSVMMAVSASGEIIALDPSTGALRHTAQLDISGARVLGAAFDADGWEPPGQAQAGAGTVAALVSIARDRDSRFDQIKELAVAALAKLPDASVTADLLALLDDPRTSAKLKDLVSSVLVTRKDPAGLPALLASLGKRTDFIEGTTADTVGVLARAVGALGETSLDAGDRSRAVGALTAHLRAPATPLMDLVDVINAIGALGGRDASDALRAHLMMYRVDDDLGASPEWGAAVVAALLRCGGPEGRETLRYVAGDVRTDRGLAALASAAVTHKP
jgi:outer membrane protein assembly factor BamB